MSFSLASKIVTENAVLYTFNLTRSGKTSADFKRSWHIVKVNSSKEAKEVKLDEGKATDEGHSVLGRDHPEVDRLSGNPETGTENESWHNFRLPFLEHLLASFSFQQSHS